ncbi:MAG: cyanophycin synthetase [Sarcina sp.]
MKIESQKIFSGKNIYSHKKVIKMVVDLEGLSNTPTKEINKFNENLVKVIPELMEHRCGIDEDHGFYIRLQEGTYLAHVFEHTIIALQNRLGINVGYGKAREIENERYYIIFEYEYSRTALIVANIALEFINSLIKQEDFNFNEKFKLAYEIFKNEMRGPSTESIYKAVKANNLPIIELGEGIYQIGYGKKKRLFSATIGDRTNAIAVDIASDKLLTKNILEANSLPVARGARVTNTIELLKEASDIGYPLVLKPQFGSKGAGVYVNINNEKELLRSFVELKSKTEDIIIEEFIDGRDYRVCVVDYKVVAVAHRTPPYVIGDGKKTIKELIDILNSDIRRGDGHEKPLTKIKLDEELDNYLKRKKLSINSIPIVDEKICLRENANISTGGFSEDCTEIISKENIDICERTARAIGLDICGIDIATNNIEKSLNEYGVIIEVNAAPGIRMHEFPTIGTKRDVANPILKTMYKGGFENIPVISVTGTNGKTTTTRLISYVISLMGYTVGMTSTDGVKIGNKYIHKGDDTGLESAKSVLINSEVDYAILETARGGIVRKGLAYEKANVGVVTNISDDHLGIDGIETIEDLAMAKSLVLEAIKEDGYAVINADDEYCEFMLERTKKYNIKTIIFSFDKNNKFILKNKEEKNPVVYLDDDFIVVYNRGKEYKICNYKYMPITLGGNLDYNIYNALAACGALVGARIDYIMIAKGFLEFKCDEKFNSGRFNIYEIDGREIILDYGHNISGYKAIIGSLKNMEKENVIGVIGVPGDRSNENISTIGRISSNYFNKIYIKEDVDKRSRKEGEVAKLLLEGVLNNKESISEVKVILDEFEAVEEAFYNSKEGDTIIIFYEEFNKIKELINKLTIQNKKNNVNYKQG